ncbi:MAG: hypothetical protein QW613_07225, partial [Thermoprotei archaeon]
MELKDGVGYSLGVLGVLTAVLGGVVVNSGVLVASGVGMGLVAATLVSLPSNALPPSAVRRMLEASLYNVEAVLEELDVSARGYYVSTGGGRVAVYAPLSGSSPGSGLGGEPPPRLGGDGGGLVVAGVGGGGSYLVVYPPLSVVDGVGGGDVDSALESYLVEYTELADSVQCVVEGGRYVLEVKGIKRFTPPGR